MQQLARELADGSFNRVTIDGDTSTNDSFVVIATQQGGARADHVARIAPTAARCAKRCSDVARQLAQAIVRDGEGATKFITVRVEGGSDGGRVPPGRLCDRAIRRW